MKFAEIKVGDFFYHHDGYCYTKQDERFGVSKNGIRKKVHPEEEVTPVAKGERRGIELKLDVK